MKLLDELRLGRQSPPSASGRSTGESNRAAQVPESVLLAAETLYSGLADLAEGLNEIGTDVRIDYEIEDVGILKDLHQRNYAVLDEQTTPPRFVFRFDCVGTRKLTRLAQTATERERIQDQLDAGGLDFSVDGKSAIRYAIAVKPFVPVRLEFAPTANGQEIGLTIHNLSRLGRDLYSIHPDEVSTELVEEIGKLILRRANRFSEMTGNVVSGEMRQRLRERLRKEGRTQSRGGGRSGVNTLQSTAKSGVPRESRRRAPIMLAHNEQEEGWVRWDTDLTSPTDPVSSSRAGAQPQPSAADSRSATSSGLFRLARYAWVITSDNRNTDPNESIAKRGPPGTSRAFPTSDIVNTGDDFRLLNKSGEMLYAGMIVGKYRGMEPLVEFGRLHDCCFIEYQHEGSWIRLGEK